MCTFPRAGPAARAGIGHQALPCPESGSPEPGQPWGTPGPRGVFTLCINHQLAALSCCCPGLSLPWFFWNLPYFFATLQPQPWFLLPTPQLALEGQAGVCVGCTCCSSSALTCCPTLAFTSPVLTPSGVGMAIPILILTWPLRAYNAKSGSLMAFLKCSRAGSAGVLSGLDWVTCCLIGGR